MLFCALTGELLNARLHEVRGVGSEGVAQTQSSCWQEGREQEEREQQGGLVCGFSLQCPWQHSREVAVAFCLMSSHQTFLPQVKHHLKGKKFARAKGTLLARRLLQCAMLAGGSKRQQQPFCCSLPVLLTFLQPSG